MDTQLIEAYRAAHYNFMWHGKIHTLKMGEPSKALQQLFESFNGTTAAYITPQNPFSKVLSDYENTALLADFEATLKTESYVYFPGEGQDPKGEWPGEQSFLVLNISRAAASAFAHHFGQNAYVYISSNCVPELVLATYGDI